MRLDAQKLNQPAFLINFLSSPVFSTPEQTFFSPNRLAVANRVMTGRKNFCAKNPRLAPGWVAGAADLEVRVAKAKF